VESILNLCANNLATVNRYGNSKNNVGIKVTNVKYSIYITAVVLYLACAGRTSEDDNGQIEAVHADDCYSQRDGGRRIYSRE
jgi:hypothetical protein